MSRKRNADLKLFEIGREDAFNTSAINNVKSGQSANLSGIVDENDHRIGILWRTLTIDIQGSQWTQLRCLLVLKCYT
jgi:hypothetical protein